MPAAMERLTLVVNHVLASEPAASERLRGHAGRCIAFQLRDWPSVLPAPPALAFTVTPAGLLEWCGQEMPAADLHVAVAADNPALLALGVLARAPRIGRVVLLADAGTDRASASEALAGAPAQRCVWIDAERIARAQRNEVLAALFERAPDAATPHRERRTR